MDLERLARMVAQAQAAKGMSDYRLEHEIGVLPDGSVFNAKQLARWKQGLRVQPIPRGFVARLIEVLDLEPLETWRAAGLWPEGIEPEDLRDLSELRAARLTAATRAALREGATVAATPLRSDQGAPGTLYLPVCADEVAA